jgi:hypothetical protein
LKEPHLKIGDKVRVIQVPRVLPKDDRLATQALFELCVGRVFPVVGFNDAGWLELEVGEALDRTPAWIPFGLNLNLSRR